MELFRKKKIGIDTEKTELSRNLNSMDLTFLGLGAMIGTGIFTVTGIAASTIAGPALIFSILIATVAITMSALIIAEFASRIPSQGGLYGYVYAVLGEFPGWIAGWLLIIEFSTGISITASGWGAYIKGFLNLHLPAFLSGPLGSTKGFSFDLIPVLIILAFSFLALLGNRFLVQLIRNLVSLKIIALVVFIVVGVFYLNIDNWNNFMPFGFWGNLFQGKGVIAGASLIYMAFLGFEVISVPVDETKNPRKNIPRGIFGALGVTAVFYILITVVLTGMVLYTKLDVTDALAFALRQVGATKVAGFISIVAMLTLVTVGFSMAYALTRLFYGMSRDGLLPKVIGKVHDEKNTLWNATILVAIMSMLSAGLFSIEHLSQFLNFSALVYLMILAVAIIKLRHDFGQPKAGEFRAPFVPLLPILSILVSLGLMSQYSWSTWVIMLGLMVLAVLIYFLYSYKHSKLRDENQENT